MIRALRNHGAAPEELAALRQLATEGGSADVLITRITELGRIYLPGFGVEPKVILGSFFQPERTMLTDLESMEPYIRASGVMLALAGDLESRDFWRPRCLPETRRIAIRKLNVESGIRM